MLLAAWGAGAILTLLSVAHIYWALGGRAGQDLVVPSRGAEGGRTFNPGPIGTGLVAAALLCAAMLVLFRAGALPAPFHMTSKLLSGGTWLLVIVFAGRALGDFHYVGLFKRVRDTPFAQWDTRLYTPLCLALAAACAAIAAS